jgi:hypothetical protein
VKNREQHQADINKAYELRLRGKTYRQIGELCGVSHVTARNWCTEHLEDVTLPLVDEVRKTEVDRMLRYLERLDTRIDDGDDKAIGYAIKISERLAKLLGADAPQQISVERKEVSQLDLDIQELIRSQEARNKLARDQVVAHKAEIGENTAEPGSSVSPSENTTEQDLT